VVSHALIVDLKAAAFEFLVTPPIRDTEPFLCSRTTSSFLDKYKLHMAINADGFYYLDPATYPPATFCADGGEPIKLIGLAASRGKSYSTKAPNRPVLYISKTNALSFDRAPSNIFNAFTGDRLLVTKGVKVSGLEAVSRDPRTAIGANKNGRFLIMVVVDGREFSEGATFPELADLLISYGAHTGMALDGGGSSAMILKGVDGKARAVNKLMDENIPGKERAVGNHLGIFIKT
jgi:exopolysaccharide biosynthesis protein